MESSKQTCPQCGEGFKCGAVDKLAKCWCQAYPPVIPVEDKAACLCALCLKQRVADALPAYLQSLGHDESLALAANYSIDNPLDEGIDYQMVEGLMVFSAWYHLKRGYCCGNGCRYCPYPKDDV